VACKQVGSRSESQKEGSKEGSKEGFKLDSTGLLTAVAAASAH